MSTNDFIEVKREDFAKYANNLQAGHCMIYARLPSMQFEGCDLRAAVLVRKINLCVLGKTYQLLISPNLLNLVLLVNTS